MSRKGYKWVTILKSVLWKSWLFKPEFREAANMAAAHSMLHTLQSTTTLWDRGSHILYMQAYTWYCVQVHMCYMNMMLLYMDTYLFCKLAQVLQFLSTCSALEINQDGSKSKALLASGSRVVYIWITDLWGVQQLCLLSTRLTPPPLQKKKN